MGGFDFVINKINPDITILDNILKEKYPNLIYKIIFINEQNEQLFNDHLNLMDLT